MRFRSLILSAIIGLLVLGPILNPLHLSREEFSPFSIPKAHAQLATGGNGASAAQGLSVFQNTLSIALDVAIVANWVGVAVAQSLLDPDTIFGPKHPTSGIRPMEVMLRALWITSRDLVNGVFGFVLLGAAIYVILGSAAGGEGGWSKVKAAGPKFVLAVILVNFSWFVPRVILDVANIATTTVFELPFLIRGDKCIAGTQDLDGDGKISTDPAKNEIIKCKYVYRIHLWPEAKECEELAAKPGGPLAAANINEEFGCPLPQQQYSPPYRGKYILGLLSIYWKDWDDTVATGIPTGGAAGGGKLNAPDLILNGLAVNFAKIETLGMMLSKDDLKANLFASDSILDQVTATMKFIVRIAFHVVLALAVGLSLIALCAALLIRMAILWICIAFMPFIFLGWAFGGQLGNIPQVGDEYNIWKKFLTYAFLPAMIGVPYAIGFMMIRAMQALQGASTAFNMPLAINVMDAFDGMGTFHEFVWMIMAVAILWTGVFAVLKKDSITAAFSQKVKSFGETGLKTLGYGVGYGLQVPSPTPGGAPISALGLRDKWENMPYAMKQYGRQSPGGGAPSGNLNTDQTKAALTKIAGNDDKKKQFTDISRALNAAIMANNKAKIQQEYENMRNLMAANGMAGLRTEQLPELMRQASRTDVAGGVQVVDRGLGDESINKMNGNKFFMKQTIPVTINNAEPPPKAALAVASEFSKITTMSDDQKAEALDIIIAQQAVGGIETELNRMKTAYAAALDKKKFIEDIVTNGGTF